MAEPHAICKCPSLVATKQTINSIAAMSVYLSEMNSAKQSEKDSWYLLAKILRIFSPTAAGVAISAKPEK